MHLDWKVLTLPYDHDGNTLEIYGAWQSRGEKRKDRANEPVSIPSCCIIFFPIHKYRNKGEQDGPTKCH